MARKVAWRTDRITNKVDEATGRRIVNLPTVPGMSKSERDALFAFEAEHLGTVRAVIRMNKRAQGDEPPVPAKLAALAAADAPSDEDVVEVE